MGVLARVGLAACSNDDSGVRQPSGEAGFVSGTGAITTVPDDEREPAPEVSGETLDGDQVSLRDYRGSVVVLNIWGSWCPPCRKEAPELVKASEALADENVQFLGIDTRDNDPAPARRFVEEFGIEYPNLYDPDGRLLLGFAGTVPPSSIPSTLVIDPQGRVAARVLGESTQTTFEELAREVADGSGGADGADGGKP